MSTSYVTIGGQEVALTPGRATLHRTPVTPKSSHQPEIDRSAMIVGLVAFLGLSVLFVVWLSRQRGNH